MQTTKIRRQELRQLGDQISLDIAGKTVRPFIGTWLQRPGISVEINLTSKTNGKRIIIHKWDDEDACSVRYITGDFWRDPDNAREFAKQENVAFSAEFISEVACQMVAATREP